VEIEPIGTVEYQGRILRKVALSGFSDRLRALLNEVNSYLLREGRGGVSFIEAQPGLALPTLAHAEPPVGWIIFDPHAATEFHLAHALCHFLPRISKPPSLPESLAREWGPVPGLFEAVKAMRHTLADLQVNYQVVKRKFNVRGAVQRAYQPVKEALQVPESFHPPLARAEMIARYIEVASLVNMAQEQDPGLVPSQARGAYTAWTSALRRNWPRCHAVASDIMTSQEFKDFAPPNEYSEEKYNQLLFHFIARRLASLWRWGLQGVA